MRIGCGQDGRQSRFGKEIGQDERRRRSSRYYGPSQNRNYTHRIVQKSIEFNKYYKRRAVSGRYIKTYCTYANWLRPGRPTFKIWKRNWPGRTSTAIISILWAVVKQ